MAANTVGVLVDMSVRGREAVRGAADDLGRIDGASKRAVSGLGGMAMSVAAAGAALGAAAFTAKRFYDTIRAGAVLQTTSQRFDKLTESIGSSSDAMIGQLRTATQGMISDMELMASASQIMSLKLAGNEDQVIRLASVVGQLGWDMNILIAEMNNMTGLRLDALGLSLNDVKEKANEFKDAGMEAGTAWREAIITLGEAKVEIGGVSESEEAFKKAEAAVANFKNSLIESVVVTLQQAGAFDALAAAADGLNLRGQLIDMKNAGQLTDAQFQELFTTMRYGGPEAAAALLDSMGKMKVGLEGVDNALLWNENGWSGWAVGVQVNAAAAADAAIAASTEIFRALVGVQSSLTGMTAAAGAGTYGGPMVTVDPWAARQAKRDANLAFVRHDPGFLESGLLARAQMDYEQAADAAYSYGAAVSTVTQEEMALAEAHSRMAATFSSELFGKAEDGLIGADGLANMQEVNKLLLEQMRLMGGTAGQMAMAAQATGDYSDEAVQAALKAAILNEKVRQIAAAVVSGQLAAGAAPGALAGFAEQLNSGAIAEAQAGIEGAAAAADEFASGTYAAELGVENRAALQAINDTIAALNGLTSGVYSVTIGVNSPLAAGPTVSTGGPEIIPNNTTGGGTPTVGGRSSGSTYNVNVTNVIDGKTVARSALDDVTTDSMKRALAEIGMGKR